MTANERESGHPIQPAVDPERSSSVMKRYSNVFRSFASIALAGGMSAACGGAQGEGGALQAAGEPVRCYRSIPLDSTDEEVQRVIDAVQAGELNPCGEGVARPEGVAEFESRDSDDYFLKLAFRFRGAGRNRQMPFVSMSNSCPPGKIPGCCPYDPCRPANTYCTAQMCPESE
jgi:hypothetical protein